MFQKLFTFTGTHELFPYGTPIHLVVDLFCRDGGLQFLCRDFIFSMTGWDDEEFDRVCFCGVCKKDVTHSIFIIRVISSFGIASGINETHKILAIFLVVLIDIYLITYLLCIYCTFFSHKCN